MIQLLLLGIFGLASAEFKLEENTYVNAFGKVVPCPYDHTTSSPAYSLGKQLKDLLSEYTDGYLKCSSDEEKIAYNNEVALKLSNMETQYGYWRGETQTNVVDSLDLQLNSKIQQVDVEIEKQTCNSCNVCKAGWYRTGDQSSCTECPMGKECPAVTDPMKNYQIPCEHIDWYLKFARAPTARVQKVIDLCNVLQQPKCNPSSCNEKFDLLTVDDNTNVETSLENFKMQCSLAKSVFEARSIMCNYEADQWLKTQSDIVEDDKKQKDVYDQCMAQESILQAEVYPNSGKASGTKPAMEKDGDSRICYIGEGDYVCTEASVIKPCDAGTFSNVTGATACVACDAGWVSNASASVCEQCEDGTEANVNVCNVCKPGTYSPDGITCLQCEPGSISSCAAEKCEVCSRGTHSSDLQDECINCQAGTYSEGNASKCKDCEGNQVAPSDGADKCTPCPQYSTTDDYKTCQCFEGFVRQSNEKKAFVAELPTCLCPPGREVRNEQCFTCSPETYRNGFGLTCKECTGLVSENSTDCIICEKPYSYQDCSCRCPKNEVWDYATHGCVSECGNLIDKETNEGNVRCKTNKNCTQQVQLQQILERQRLQMQMQESLIVQVNQQQQMQQQFQYGIQQQNQGVKAYSKIRHVKFQTFYPQQNAAQVNVASEDVTINITDVLVQLVNITQYYLRDIKHNHAHNHEELERQIHSAPKIPSNLTDPWDLVNDGTTKEEFIVIISAPGADDLDNKIIEVLEYVLKSFTLINEVTNNETPLESFADVLLALALLALVFIRTVFKWLVYIVLFPFRLVKWFIDELLAEDKVAVQN